MKKALVIVGGSLVAAGTYMLTLSDPPWITVVGQVLIGIGSFLAGVAAPAPGQNKPSA